jgi:NitT/TauT family transport system ATP-binding protein
MSKRANGQHAIPTHPGAVDLLEVDGVRKVFRGRRDEQLVLNDVSFSCTAGSFISIVGPSGCGKSTLLQIVGGLIEPSSGWAYFAGQEIHGPPFDVIYIFQQYTKSIFPWKTVNANISFGLVYRNHAKRRDARNQVKQYVAAMGLEGFEDHYPWQLSGGMQQRVALARALACKPRVLMMDEPFSAVDALTRSSLQDLVLEAWQQEDLTIIFVTHDVDEAVYLSDRVLVMSPRPGEVIADISIDLPYPRDQIETRENPAFLEYRREILTSIR